MIKRCCFSGHRDIINENELSKKIFAVAEMLVPEEDVREFFVGGYGKFDSLVASSVSELRKKHPEIHLYLVLPYLTKRVANIDLFPDLYDGIILANIPESTPPKYRIIKCNHYMIDKSDFLVTYVNCDWGGAAKALDYAKKTNIKIIGLGALK